ncbi:MAG: ketoacyl-ACP synthase III [Actinobacteria bacterium]|nr:ketoacyl-ACP synthase III [Actinomycetota bacterium]
MQATTRTGGLITGWGAALPDKVVTNEDLVATLDTTEDWIVERTGIRERRVGGTTAGLAVEAGQRALDTAGLSPTDIELLILCTTTPDMAIPSTASLVQDELGTPGGAVDLNAACSGFVYGLVAAHGHVALGYERILLIGAETMSRVTDWDDRNTAVLFGDGAGAVVLEATGGVDGLLGFDLGSDGSARHLLEADIGGFMRMEGREVFRRAVRAVVDTANRAMQRAGVTIADLALVVPHQANIRIIESAARRLGISMDRTVNVLETTGNTSAASIPMGLVHAVESGRLHGGDLVLLVGFGAGMSWAAAVIRWGTGA